MTKKQEQLMICPNPEGCPDIECEHMYAHYKNDTESSWGCDTPCHCPACIPYEQPTPTMPLRELDDVDKELLATIKGHITFQCGCGEICQSCENTSRDIMHSIFERDKAHDSEVAAEVEAKIKEHICPSCKKGVASKAVNEFVEKVKLIWYILDEIACKHSATHIWSGKQPCPICDRAEEAMKLCQFNPTPKECQTLFESRRAMAKE